MELIAKNRKAYHNFTVLDQFECGIELKGTEIKSIRGRKMNLADSYAVCRNGEMILRQMHISPFEQASEYYNHDPYRERKLLLHKKEIFKICQRVERENLTIVPLGMYFKKQWVKMKIAVCKGKKKYDKRQKINEKESKKSMARVKGMMRRR